MLVYSFVTRSLRVFGTIRSKIWTWQLQFVCWHEFPFLYLFPTFIFVLGWRTLILCFHIAGACLHNFVRPDPFRTCLQLSRHWINDAAPHSKDPSLQHFNLCLVVTISYTWPTATLNREKCFVFVLPRWQE